MILKWIMNCVFQFERFSPGEPPPVGKWCFFGQVWERQCGRIGEWNTGEQPEDKWKRERSVRDPWRGFSRKERDNLCWTDLWRIWGGKGEVTTAWSFNVSLLIVFVIQPSRCMAVKNQLCEFQCFTDRAMYSFLLNYVELSCALIIMHYEQLHCWALACLQHQRLL